MVYVEVFTVSFEAWKGMLTWKWGGIVWADLNVLNFNADL